MADLNQLLVRLRAANPVPPSFAHVHEPDLLQRLASTEVVIGDSGEDVEPKRRKRRPSLASVAKQATRAGFEVAGYEIRPDGVIKIITGKPADASAIDLDDPAPIDRSDWN